METFKIVVLAVSGLLLVFVGISRLTNPIKTYAKNSGINLNNDVSLLNEIRGVSAVMLSAGLLSWTGIFVTDFAYTSHVVAALLFIGFLIGRLYSLKVDGAPSKELKQGIVFEFILGGINLWIVLSQF